MTADVRRATAWFRTALPAILGIVLVLGPGFAAQAQTPRGREDKPPASTPDQGDSGKITNRAEPIVPGQPSTTPQPQAQPAPTKESAPETASKPEPRPSEDANPSPVQPAASAPSAAPPNQAASSAANPGTGSRPPLLAAPPSQLGNGELPGFTPPPVVRKQEPPAEDKRPDGPDWRWSDAPVDAAFGAYQRGLYVTALREAMKSLEKDPGNAASMTLMGELYRDGLGVKPNPAEAVRWYQLADKQGDPNAAFALARAYIEGAGVKQDHAKAKEYFERAAAKNHPAALYNLGIMAIEGEIQDFNKAADLFKRGMALGNIDCIYTLALLHREGQGVEKNEEEATRLLKRAADEHHIAAMVDYAIALFNGRGTRPDERGAARYLIRAAWRNSPVAQNRLARMYLAGRGVKADPIEAMKWHVLATSNGLKDAWLDGKMTQLTPAQREMVEEAVRKFGVR